MKTLLLAFLLTGCGSLERGYTGLTGGLTYKCSKHGVEYIQSDSGLAVSLDKEGRPITCEK